MASSAARPNAGAFMRALYARRGTGGVSESPAPADIVSPSSQGRAATDDSPSSGGRWRPSEIARALFGVKSTTSGRSGGARDASPSSGGGGASAASPSSGGGGARGGAPKSVIKSLFEVRSLQSMHTLVSRVAATTGDAIHMGLFPGRHDASKDDGEMLPPLRSQNLSRSEAFRLRQAFIEPPDRRVAREALCGLRRSNAFRMKAMKLAQNDLYRWLVFAAVIGNMIALASRRPSEDVGSVRNMAVDDARAAFSYFFTFDIALQLLVCGVCGQHAYFSKFANWFDLFVVVCGWLSTIVPSFTSLDALRAFRIFRNLAPLPGLRAVINASTSALPDLLNVFMLIVVLCFFFSMIGIELWGTRLAPECAWTDTDGSTVFSSSYMATAVKCTPECASLPTSSWCSVEQQFQCPTALVPFSLPDGTSLVNSTVDAISGFTMYNVSNNNNTKFVYDGVHYLASAGLSCQWGGANPDWGQSSYDNMGMGMLMAFIITTTEGWSAHLYNLWAAWGLAPVSSLMVVFHLLVGNLIFTELALAVVWAAFVKSVMAASDRFDVILAALQKLPRDAMGHAIFDSENDIGDSPTGPNDLRFVTIPAVGTTPARILRLADLVSVSEASSVVYEILEERLQARLTLSKQAAKKVAVRIAADALDAGHDLHEVNSQMRIARTISHAFLYATLTDIEREPPAPHSTHGPLHRDILEKAYVEAARSLAGDCPAGLPDDAVIAKPRRAGHYYLHAAERAAAGFAPADLVTKDRRRFQKRRLFIYAWLEAVLFFSEKFHLPARVGVVLRAMVESPWFDSFFFCAVVCNAVVLGCPYVGMSTEYELNLRYAQIVFSVLYIVECLLKILALGLRRFVSDRHNLFDSVIVFISFFEVIYESAGTSSIGLNVLRATRLFRLFRSWKSLSALSLSLTRAIPHALSGFTMLGIFCIVFGTLGMGFFGTRYESAISSGIISSLPNSNFATFPKALLTIFQVLDNENWNDVVHQHMAITNPAAALFFLIVIIAGNYIFLNMFVAIMLSAADEFASDPKDHQNRELSGGPAFNKAIAKVKSAVSSNQSEQAAEILKFVLTMHRRSETADVHVVQHALTWRQKFKKHFEKSALRRFGRQLNTMIAARQAAVTRLLLRGPRGGRRVSADARKAVTASNAAEDPAPTTAQVTPLVVHRRKPVHLSASFANHPTATFITTLAGTTHGVLAKLPAPKASTSVRLKPKSKSSLRSRGNNTVEKEERAGGLSTVVHLNGLIEVSQTDLEAVSHDVYIGVVMERFATAVLRTFGVSSSGTLKELAREQPSRTLGCCTREMTTRVIASRIFFSSTFSVFSLAALIISCVNLALDEPNVQVCGVLPASNPLNCLALVSYVSVSEYVLTAFFISEMCLSILVKGLFFQKGAYFRSGWTVLDFLCVITSIVSISIENTTSTFIRSFRALRVLRVFRVFQRVDALRIIVYTLLQAMPRALNAMVVIFLWVYIFAIIALQTLRGTANYCNDSLVSTKEACVGTFVVVGYSSGFGGGMGGSAGCPMMATTALEKACLNSPTGGILERTWGPVPWHFDYLGNALLVVWELLTGENWPVYMSYGIDSVGYDQPQAADARLGFAAYYVCAEIILNFLVIELFSTVIMDVYIELVNKSGGCDLVSPEQRIWIENLRFALFASPTPKSRPMPSTRPWLHALRASAFSTVNSKRFDFAINAVLVFNILVMFTAHVRAEDEWQYFWLVANIIITVVFCIESALKMLGYGVEQYLSTWTHVFEFLLAIVSIISLALSKGVIGVIFRILRALRLFRLARLSPRFQRLLTTVFMIVPPFLNILVVVAINYFVFAIIGMNIFQGVKYGWLGFLDSKYANFDSFFLSYMTIVRCGTGENFNGIMHELAVQAPYCIPGENCGSPYTSVLFFVVFFSVTSFVILSITSGVAVKAFDDADPVAFDYETGLFRLNAELREDFINAWARRDVDGTHFLCEEDVAGVIAELPAPMGVLGVLMSEADYDLCAEAEEKVDAQARARADALLAIPTVESRAKGARILKRLNDANARSQFNESGKRIPKSVLRLALMKMRKLDIVPHQDIPDAVYKEEPTIFRLIFQRFLRPATLKTPSEAARKQKGTTVFHFHAVLHALVDPVSCNVAQFSVNQYPHDSHLDWSVTSIPHRINHLIASLQRHWRARQRARGRGMTKAARPLGRSASGDYSDGDTAESAGVRTLVPSPVREGEDEPA